VTIHTDTLNESGCVEQSISAFKGRTIHTVPQVPPNHCRAPACATAGSVARTPLGPFSL